MGRALHNHQWKNSLRGSLKPKRLGPKYKGMHIHKRNVSKAQNKHWTSHNKSGRFQHPTLTNGQVIETETKLRHSETKRGYEPNEFDR